jgi:hypothetical protein
MEREGKENTGDLRDIYKIDWSDAFAAPPPASVTLGDGQGAVKKHPTRVLVAHGSWMCLSHGTHSE